MDDDPKSELKSSWRISIQERRSGGADHWVIQAGACLQLKGLKIAASCKDVKLSCATFTPVFDAVQVI
jgi:hypothetical protein